VELKNKKIILISLLVITVLAAAISAGCISSGDNPEAGGEEQTITITDMAGRDIEVPSEINSILCTSPPSAMLVYMIAPDKLAGWNSAPGEINRPYIPEKYLNLPVCGGWFGKQTGNYETFIEMDPDIVIEGFNTQGDFKTTIIERQDKMGDIPVVGLEDTVNAAGYTAPIRFTGELLGEEERAEALITFYEDILGKVDARVSGLGDSEKPTVYYAEGPEGLWTDPEGSQHSQLIELCGGTNIADCPLTPGYGRTTVSMEQIISWDPEIILAGDPAFYESVHTDPNWKDIKAVKEGKVYLVPTTAFCWFDRPPGINRIIGIAWTAKVLHPELFEDFDMREMAQYYHENFIHQALTEEQMDELGL